MTGPVRLNKLVFVANHLNDLGPMGEQREAVGCKRKLATDWQPEA